MPMKRKKKPARMKKPKRIKKPHPSTLNLTCWSGWT